MIEENQGQEQKKRLFSKVSKGEVQKLMQGQSQSICQMASMDQDTKECLFEHIDSASENNRMGAEPLECSDDKPKRVEDMGNIQEIVKILESLSKENCNMPIEICPQAVGQSYSGNAVPSYMPQSPLVPAQMAAQDGGKRQGKRAGIDIDNAGFVYSGGNLFAVDGELSEKVGNFALEILERKEMVEEIVNEANDVIGSESRVVWLIKIMLPGREYQGYVEDAKIFEPSWIAKISEHRAVFSSNPNSKKLLWKYLQDLILAERYCVKREFSSPGWKWLENGVVCYLTADGAVGFEGNDIKASDRFKLCTMPAEKRQNLMDFLNMRGIIPGNPKNAVFLQYYLMAALLTALFKKSGHQLEFCVALIGKTNTKKTSCGEIFTRIFNRTPSAVPEINFSATDAAIYEIMDHFADAIVMIDDLTPSENDMDARKKGQKLESIIRAYGDRVPRRRSVAFAANINAKEFVPINGCALITGETFSGGKSSRSRVVVLHFEEGDVDNSALAYYQNHLYTLPNFVENFLCYVTGNLGKVMEIINYECKRARKSMGNFIRLPRYVDAFGALSALVSIFGGYIAKLGFMNQDDVNKLMEADRELLLQVIMENDGQVAQVSPGITILEALKYATDKHKICVKNLWELEDDKPEDYLLYDDNFYFITSDRLWECAKPYTDYRNIYFPYKNGREIMEPLKAEEILFVKKEGSTNRASHKITINGKLVNKRFLLIPKGKLDKIWGDLEDY